ncbi:MAG: transglycosylase SLT domain-containing protein [Deltaproteobacteria bacterium]|nr:transglycosylase SLT domain-containing protein [Deltaproteobacteria bacterium]
MNTLNYADKLARASSQTAKRPGAGRTSRWGGASIRVAAVAAIGLVVTVFAVSAYRTARETGAAGRELARSLGRAVTPVLSAEDTYRLQVIQQVLAQYPGLPEADRAVVGETIFVESRRHGLDPLLVLAVASHESGFRRTATSYAGARGIMQVMPATGRAISKDLGLSYPGDDVLYDPVFSIRLGTYYLARMRHHEPRLDMALTAYNMGLGRLREIRATRELNDSVYSRRVMGYYRKYQRQYLLAALGQKATTQTALATSDAAFFAAIP